MRDEETHAATPCAPRASGAPDPSDSSGLLIPIPLFCTQSQQTVSVSKMLRMTCCPLQRGTSSDIFFVDPSKGHDGNHGRSLGSAFATVQRCVDRLREPDAQQQDTPLGALNLSNGTNSSKYTPVWLETVALANLTSRQAVAPPGSECRCLPTFVFPLRCIV